MKKNSVLNFGGIGDGIADDALAIQNTIDECHKNGGGTVYFPAGKTFLSSPFKLQSNITLWVEKGAKIVANPDESVYTESAFRANKGEGTIWIGGENLENITIMGGGIIDGNGIAFMGKEQKEAYDLKPFEEVDPRPHLLTLINAENININNVTFKDAAYWGLHFIGCNKVLISDIFIFNDLKIRNGDGIDLEYV